MSDDKRVRVGILMGSSSDWPTVQHAALVLDELGVGNEARVLSAHRSPAAALEYATSAADRGLQVIICAAGGAAHLGGVIAAHTHLPVLGIPMKGWATDGLDALLCAIQAAWAYTKADAGYGIPAHCNPNEGWIVDPQLG